MNSKPPKPNSQVSIYMNLQNEIAEKYSNLPYTLKKLQDFTFSEIKFLVGGVRTPPYKHLATYYTTYYNTIYFEPGELRQNLSLSSSSHNM